MLGPLRLHLDFASPALAAIFGDALAVQQTDADPPVADVQDWQLTVAAGTPAPAQVPAGAGGEMRLLADADTYALWMGRHAPVLHMVDRRRRQALYWVADPAAVPAWERSRPFLPILQAMLDETPWIAVHGAAIACRAGAGHRAVLLAGAGHAGKTSLSLAGLATGWRFAGDDFVLLRTDDRPAVAPLYATARLRDDMLAQFAALLPARREISEEQGERRHELSLAGRGSIGGAPLGALLLLERRGAAAPLLAPVTRSALLQGLAATTAVATPGHAAARTGKLLRLLGGTGPARRFDPGPDFPAALSALRALLA
ncbi:hypothetical protein [Humitalea rosea]|uniref:hypothetical protein n=1 Tax=Humitalea rosea TaxID=990373 RepID=UPI001313D82D|nr:hypothetical protein [Humitalea rosea]